MSAQLVVAKTVPTHLSRPMSRSPWPHRPGHSLATVLAKRAQEYC